MADMAPTLHPILGEDFREEYANTFRLRLGQSDSAIIFGYQTLDTAGFPVIRDKVEIIITPVLMKILRDALISSVKTIEEATGEIKVPAQQQLPAAQHP